VGFDPLYWLASTSLVVTCLAAIAAGSLREFSPSGLEEICRRHNRPERLTRILRRRDAVRLAMETLQVLGTALFLGATSLWLAGGWNMPAEGHRLMWWTWSMAGAALVLLVAEIWVPWAAGRLWADPFLYHTWPVWEFLSLGLSPLVAAARIFDTVLHRLAGRAPDFSNEGSFEDDIRTIVTEGHREGLLEEEAREMIEGVIDLNDADVSEIMTPRTEMISMPVTLTWSEALQFVINTGHSRIPVYNKNRDDIVGVLYSKDLLPELAKEPGQRSASWTALLRSPVFVPETKPINALLQELQRTRNHMAIVLDEYGGVSGLVSLEDVLEEIVGEIADEYDDKTVEAIRKVGEGVCEALGRVHIDEINERLGLRLPEDADFDTLGGFVFSELGRIPSVGEQLTWDNARITVLDATRRRVDRVRIEIMAHPGGEAT